MRSRSTRVTKSTIAVVVGAIGLLLAIIWFHRWQDDVRDLIDLARQLEDLTRNAGKHAGGVVIAPSPLSDFCPLFAEHDGHGGGAAEEGAGGSDVVGITPR